MGGGVKVKQNIPASFIQYVKYYMGKSGISTRELSGKVDKSTNYISSILLGKIQTIEFGTALRIIETINPQVEPVELLVENFNIEPEELIQQRWKEMEEKQERILENIKECEEITEIISANIMQNAMQDTYLVKANAVKKVSELSIDSDTLEIIDKICDSNLEGYKQFFDLLLAVIKDKNNYQILLNAVVEFYSQTDDIFADCTTYPGENSEIRNKIKKIREELDNGRPTTKEKEKEV